MSRLPLLRSGVTSASLAIAFHLLAAPASSYTIESQSLRVGVGAAINLYVCDPEPFCFEAPFYDTDAQTVTGTGELDAAAEATARDAYTRAVTAGSTLAADEIALAATHQSNFYPNESGNYWLWEWQVVFTVAEATPFTVQVDVPRFETIYSVVGVHLFDLDRGEFVVPTTDDLLFETSGTLQAGRYRLYSFWENVFAYDFPHEASVVLALVPEPGSAVLVATGLAAVAGARRRR